MCYSILVDTQAYAHRNKKKRERPRKIMGSRKDQNVVKVMKEKELGEGG